MRALKAALLRFLRVPPEPHLPQGDPGTALVFRAAGPYLNLKLIGWGARQMAALIGLVVATMAINNIGSFQRIVPHGDDPRATVAAQVAVPILHLLEAFSWVAWLVQLPITFQLALLDWELRWYIVTDRAVRLREGITTLREMTFTLANVQDLSIKRGPLQQLLGIADLEVRTAGGGGGQDPTGKHQVRDLHKATFRGIDNAEALRDLVRARMRASRDAGLGDPDDPHKESIGTSLAPAIEELRRESGALRQAVERGR